MKSINKRASPPETPSPNTFAKAADTIRKDFSENANKPKKLTLKQENFCMAYIETGNASEAYRKSFNATKMKDVTITKRASELLANGDIKGMIEQLRKPIIARHNITVDRLILELEDARQLALHAETPQASAAVAATMAKAKLLGFLDKVKATGSTENPIAELIHQLQGTAIQVGEGFIYDWGDDSDDSPN